MIRQRELSACGVGFVTARTGVASHDILQRGLGALEAVEHRGGLLADGVTGDGAGVMTDIPFELLGYASDSVVVGSIFLRTPPHRRQIALSTFEETFHFFDFDVLGYRTVPVNTMVLGQQAIETLPELLHVFISRPAFCRTHASLNQRLYLARQRVRTKLKQRGVINEFFFSSMSTTTIVYKALTTSAGLADFYEDLRNSAYKTRFCVFHRRFSTNTATSWDKAQPFRLIAHNGEINTIRGNRSWSYSREQALGLPIDELLTHQGISDSGGLNEMTEALTHRSSIPELEDVLALMLPPAGESNNWYRFWARAVEPWDGPAFIAWCDGNTIGGRLDRNGFRPCRWALTDELFTFASEAGVFDLDAREVVAKGTLHAGRGVKVDLSSGEVHFHDPSESRENRDAELDARLVDIRRFPVVPSYPTYLQKKRLFGLHREEHDQLLLPMIIDGKEPIGSMGDTSRMAVLSEQPRSLFDYFYQTFAQVTNPPLDVIRERMVTDLTTYLGKRPNIFAPRELLPPTPALLLTSPVLRLGHMSFLRTIHDYARPHKPRIRCRDIATTFSREQGAKGLEDALARIADEALAGAREGVRVLILTDRTADWAHPPVPSLLALRAVVRVLNAWGLRLECSIVVETGDVHTTHALAALIAFGATAVCPALAFEIARFSDTRKLRDLDPDTREENAARAFEDGLLKVMSKMGISVARSYQSAKLFTAIGLSSEVLSRFFFSRSDSMTSIGGLTLRHIAEDVLRHTRHLAPNGAAPPGDDDELAEVFLLREHNKGLKGEQHAMTASRTRIVHEMVRAEPERAAELYEAYLADVESARPITPRHLLEPTPAQQPLDADAVESRASITRRFGSGAMSFGAISAEAQRDIIVAMRRIGGRSNSGEGGENPYYYVDGTTASTKQVASARFGVTAEYLVVAGEIEIKVAQGAKPGEGGQLMAVKVDEHIARARFARPGVDLISPPPLHDIYSIEDLKELIFQLKQLGPARPVCVKLVSGVNIGTIAAGVVKAGADVVQISGGDGGTGAATITSMHHAGLPWELGLAEVHAELVSRGLRDNVTLRVDGGLLTGEDIVVASALGADEFGFGKLLLIAEGCIMARICEKNTCPRGIATHAPRFKKKYIGLADDVVRVLELIADDVRRQLARIGVRSLDELRGQAHMLRPSHRHAARITERGLDLRALNSTATRPPGVRGPSPFLLPVTELNQRIVDDASALLESGENTLLEYPVRSTDRAVLASLAATLATRVHRERMARLEAGEVDTTWPQSPHLALPEGRLRLRFKGSAGQGFAVFLQAGVDVELIGEANDSVGKSMGGGTLVVRPPDGSRFLPESAAIIGNCALYGATGGVVLVSGSAGDRFAVRNSGAVAVVDHVGLHACGYMTSGTVVLLGESSFNLGSGMTGGVLYCRRDNGRFINTEYLVEVPMAAVEAAALRALVELHAVRTKSPSSAHLLERWEDAQADFALYVPHTEAARRAGDEPAEA